MTAGDGSDAPAASLAGAPRKTRPGRPILALIVAPILAMALTALVVAGAARLLQAPVAFALAKAPKDLPPLVFMDAKGHPRRLDDERGKVVLLNLWATWCLPCRTEMPTLDRLQARLGGLDFQVIALSLDRQGPAVVHDFYASTGIKQLELLIDPSAKAARVLGAAGLPTTLLIDRQGREIGRLLGPADWDAPQMVALFQQIIAAPDQKPSAPPS